VVEGGGKRRATIRHTGVPIIQRQPPPGPAQCHPASEKEAGAHGCLPHGVLEKVAKQIGVSTSLKGKALRTALEGKLAVSKPNAERTFLQALPLSAQEKSDLARRYLRPAMPKSWFSDPDEWLDSINIGDVLNQYEDAFPSFEFMGPFPIDFAAPDPYSKGGGAATGERCLMNEICELRIKKALENGTKAVGIVYNLDPHFKGGSHWIANYIDIPGHRCYYFDSYGMAPPKQIERFMKWLTTQDPEMRLEYNTRRLQFRNTECGIYCIYFIIRMLAGDKFLDITRRKPSDEDMMDLRDWLFSI